MSSWLSLNPFKSQQQQQQQDDSEQEAEEEDQNQQPSVQQDLSQLGKTLSRQLWGVASFLAPPPSTTTTTTTDDDDPSPSSSSSSQTLLGIRNDFAEISGSLKSGFNLISTNKAVNEISKLASNLLQFQDHDDEQEEEESRSGAVGITEESLQFVEEISLRPECWIDFPLPLDDYDFDMSNAQKDHVAAIENLCPSLEDLRGKLCPGHMTEEHFWIIYFILLHPRLNQHNSELLSTPQIVEVRTILLETMQARKNANLQTPKVDDLSSEVNDKDNDAQDESSMAQENEFLAKTVNAGHQEDADVDRWLQDDVETGTSVDERNPILNEQDVTFSDLEEDDSDTLSRQGGSSPQQNAQSPEWVQLSENSEAGDGRKKGPHRAAREKDSEGEESSDWLTVDEFDSDNAGTV